MASPKELTIELSLPHRDLTGNGRISWQAKARHTKQARQWAAWAARVEMGRRESTEPYFSGPCAVSATWVLPKHGKELDGDNAAISLKNVWDGFTDAGVWRDDKGNQYAPIVFTREADCPTGRVVVTLKPLNVGGKEGNDGE